MDHTLRLVLRGWEIVELQPPAAGACYLVARTGHKFRVSMVGNKWWAELVPLSA